MPADVADVRLRERLVARDGQALAEAYHCWSGLVRGLVVRLVADHATAEDLTQDVFVHLWQRPHAYDPARGPLRAWLCVLARSRALDWLRRLEVRDRCPAAVPVAPPPDVADEVLRRVRARAVREAVADLPGKQREAVLLAFGHGYTYRQVACLLEIPEGTAKSRLRAALASLGRRLDPAEF